MSYHYTGADAELRLLDADQAQLLGQMRRYPMQVLCGSCGGLGCEHCEPPEPPSRWLRFYDTYLRRAKH